MQNIRVNKFELRDTLTKNRAEHRKIFEEAVEGYRKEVISRLEDHLERVKEGSLIRVYVSLPQPSDHTADYDRALQMLEWSLDEEIEIDEQTFSELVMDDWSWKREFLTTNSAYSMLAERSAAKL